jgi:acyl-CoA synthetase (AMP-forming)/AMP-acid ligase II
MMLLEMANGAMGDRVAVGDKDHGLRYSDLYEKAGRAASYLRATSAESVLYTDLTSPLLPVALFASSWAGLPFVPLNYRLPDDKLQAQIGRMHPAVLLYGEGTRERMGHHTGVDMLSTSHFDEQLLLSHLPDPDWSMEQEDKCVLLFTSGTSGEPKIAVLRQKNLVSYILGSVEFMGAEEHEATLVSVPPYHIAGMASILSSVFSGRRLYQMQAFDAVEWVRIAREQEITHAMVVPTMLARILDVLADGKGLPAMRHLAYGGGRMPLPVIEHAVQLLPDVNFVNAYGLTETSSSIALLGPQDHRDALASADPDVRRRLGSVGRPLPTVEIEIRDEEGKPVPAGVKGEVYVRGEQVSGEYTVKTGVVSDGWFPTADGGWFDEEGFLFVEGRIDDVIVRGGENLSPGEIEDVILAHPAVQEVAVVGVPDTQWGETVAAVIVVYPEHTVTDDEIRDYVTKKLRSTKSPAIIERRLELPYNDTGKVLRRVLRAELAEKHA